MTDHHPAQPETRTGEGLPEELRPIAADLDAIGSAWRDEPGIGFEARLRDGLEHTPSAGARTGTTGSAIPGRRRARWALSGSLGALAAAAITVAVLLPRSPAGPVEPMPPSVAAADDDELLFASFEVLDGTLAWADDSLDELAASVDGLASQDAGLTANGLDDWLEDVWMEQPL